MIDDLDLVAFIKGGWRSMSEEEVLEHVEEIIEIGVVLWGVEWLRDVRRSMTRH